MMTTRKKQNLIKVHALTPNDTGSAPVQVALLTARIREITEHLKTHKKDLSSRMGLVKMVSARRRMLNYIRKNDPMSYEPLITKLDIRK